MPATPPPPRFSLILCTVGHAAGLERLIASLHEQTVQDFELIVVDQNQDDRLQGRLKPLCDGLSWRRITSAPGLSHARNQGMKWARGQTLGFPDDDCWYPPRLLDDVRAALDEHPGAAGLTTRCTDDRGEPVHCWWPSRSGWITPRGAWFRCNSNTMFLNRWLFDDIGGFDERLGPGATSGMWAADDTEYIIRAVSDGHQIRYCAELCTHHPMIDADDQGNTKKVLSYARSAGFALGLHRFAVWFVGLAMAQACVAAGSSAIKRNGSSVARNLAVARERWRGYLLGRRDPSGPVQSLMRHSRKPE